MFCCIYPMHIGFCRYELLFNYNIINNYYLYCSNNLSNEENVNIFGKCNNKNGHGHNYKGI